MFNTKLIADSIPVDEMNAAIASIGPDKVQMTFSTTELDENGNRLKIPSLDDQGNPIMMPGGFSDLIAVGAAFDAIKGSTTVISRGDYDQTYIGISKDASITIAAQFEASINAAIIANDLPNFISGALSGNGVNINNSQVASKLNSFVADNEKHGFSQALVDAVLATGNEMVPVFSGLKLGHVQNAIHRRAQGEI